MHSRAFHVLFPIIAVLFGCSGHLYAQLATSPWPCFRLNQYHNARSTSIGPSTDLVAWTYQIGGTGTSSPAVGTDRIYVVSGGSLLAIDFSGELIWSFASGSSSFSSPAIASDGTVYVASSDGYLYAVTPQGSLQWKRSLQGASDCSPTIGPDGLIYAGSSSMRLFAFYPNGNQKFSYLAGGLISSSAAIASDGTIYFGCEDGKLYALYANGTLKWKFSVTPSAAIKSSPAIGSDGSIYFGSMAGYLYAIRPAGTQIWRFGTSGAIVSSPAIATGGNIIFGSRDGSLYSVSSSGSQVWKYYTGSYVDSSPAIDSNGAVYFGSYTGSVYALSASGSLIWSKSIGTGVISSPAIGQQGTLYVLNYDGILSAFGGDTTPPPAPSVLDDGAYSTQPTALHASWSCNDPESGISRYEYAIGTSAGAEDLVHFTDIGSAVEITRSDLTLVNGADYYFSVRAINGAGLVSAVGLSDGIRIDFTPPASPLVIDDGDWIGVSDQLHFVYGSGDTESGIFHYAYSIGTSPGSADVYGWMNAYNIKEQTITDLNLKHSVFYYVNIRAYNHAGLMSEGYSNGIRPDLTKPDIDAITPQATTTQIKTTITASDPESGVSEVQYVLLTSPDLPASPEWLPAGNSQEITIAGPFDWTKTYYIAARAKNGVGAWSQVELSTAIKADDTPPSTPVVLDDGIYSTSNTDLHASWSSTDDQSGIREYSYCVGTSAGASNTLAWTTTTNDFASLTGINLTSGYTYYFTVRAINGAGIASVNGSSDGIKIDLTAPAVPIVYDDGDYTYSADSLRASWLSNDSESGLAEYSFCVGTAAGLSDITGWSSSGMQSWAAVSGLALQSGVRYYFTVKAKNGAGLWGEPSSSDGIEYKSGITVWPKFRCNPTNNGCSVVSGCLTSTLRWSYQTQGYVESSAAIAGDGTVYVGSSDGILYALNSSGGLRWSYQTSGPIDSSPAINAFGDVYFGSYDGGLYCLSSSGALKWRYQTTGMIWSSPNFASDGTAIFGCQDGHVYALKSDGTLKWSYNTGTTVWSSPAIGADGSIYFGCGDGRLCALTSDGSFKWSYQTGSAIDSSPAVDSNGVIYVGSGDACFYAINPDGTKKWHKDMGMVVDSSAAITADGKIYFGAGIVGGKGAFYSLDSAGNTLWHMSLPGAVRSSPAIGQDGTIYFGCADGTLYALEPNGGVIWQHKVSQSILSSPALGPDSSVVAGSDDGCVYCFRDAAAGDTTSPTTPIVTLDREALAPGLILNGSWSATDADSGIQYFSYAVGTSPGGTDAINWTNVGTSTSAAINSGLLSSSHTYYLSVTATNWAGLTSGIGVSKPFTVLSTALENAIGWAKQCSVGSAINLKGKVVTAVFSDCVFVEEINRSSGIRCLVSGSTLEAGMIVDITGSMGVRYGERVINSAVLTDTNLRGEVKPFYMPNDFATRPGIDPTGLLVRIFGRVKRSGDGYIVVSDGSYIVSPRGVSGIEIKTASGLPVGTYVTATGIACRELINSRYAPALRSVEDISPIAAIAPAE